MGRGYVKSLVYDLISFLVSIRGFWLCGGRCYCGWGIGREIREIVCFRNIFCCCKNMRCYRDIFCFRDF